MNIDFNQNSSIRGLVWTIGGILSSIATLFKSIETGAAIMSITATVAGGLGMILDDNNQKEEKKTIKQPE